ncbi:MAG: sugar dehydrogenase, partial [Candidatus Tectomicrobia bacterium]|nr:sugar dehydrogenase [Candidatus Tectomicrobia bacterium]
WPEGAFAFSTWGEDLEGELYFGHARDTIPLVTLAQALDATPDPPAWLSQTSAFSDLQNLVPSAAWLPYDLNQPFWSDGAVKQRWIALPAGGQIVFSENDNWVYPVGTVFMKHFDLPLDDADPTLTTRLETRFMVHGENGWYGVTYRWNEDQTDAAILTVSESETYTIATSEPPPVPPEGGSREQVWAFPSRTDCVACHNAAAGGALGPRTHQINGEFFYPQPGIMDNQLAVWNRLEMLSPMLDPTAIPTFLRSVAQDDTTAPLEDRARSYLDSNCSYCHRPETGNRATFDTRFTTPLGEQGLINGVVVESFDLPDEAIIRPGCVNCSLLYHRLSTLGSAEMPPLAKNRVDTPGVALIQTWIESLEIIE